MSTIEDKVLSLLDRIQPLESLFYSILQSSSSSVKEKKDSEDYLQWVVMTKSALTGVLNGKDLMEGSADVKKQMEELVVLIEEQVSGLSNLLK